MSLVPMRRAPMHMCVCACPLAWLATLAWCDADGKWAAQGGSQHGMLHVWVYMRACVLRGAASNSQSLQMLRALRHSIRPEVSCV